MVMGPAQCIWIHITYGGTDGNATDGWVGFMLGASTMCPHSCCSSGFFGIVIGPLACYVSNVLEAIKDSEWTAKEGGPPCVWDWEQCWDAMPCAIHSQGEEHIIAAADGVLSCGGASVGSEEVSPVTHGA